MEITFSLERQIIESEFLKYDLGIPVQFDNVSQLSLNGTMVDQDDVDEWIRLTILHYDTNPTSIGSVVCSSDRIDGEVILSVFVRENKGSGRTREILDLLYPIFNRKTINGINFRSGVLSEIPPINGWYMVNLGTDFQYDKCLKGE